MPAAEIPHDQRIAFIDPILFDFRCEIKASFATGVATAARALSMQSTHCTGVAPRRITHEQFSRV
jgi:hypothetical protein